MAGPDFSVWIGRAISSSTAWQPPTEVLTSRSPAKPADCRSAAISRRWRCISGFSDASMAVAEARRYSRRMGTS